VLEVVEELVLDVLVVLKVLEVVEELVLDVLVVLKVLEVVEDDVLVVLKVFEVVEEVLVLLDVVVMQTAVPTSTETSKNGWIVPPAERTEKILAA
jgi:hypothetical protein